MHHAAYGTVGFNESIISTRVCIEISQIISREAQKAVHQCWACNRKIFFTQIGNRDSPKFKNRLTRESYHSLVNILKHFCGLTATIETNISIGEPEFISEYGAVLNSLFLKMSPYLSKTA